MFSGSRGISQSSSSLTVTLAPLGRAGVAPVTCGGNLVYIRSPDPEDAGPAHVLRIPQGATLSVIIAGGTRRCLPSSPVIGMWLPICKFREPQHSFMKVDYWGAQDIFLLDLLSGGMHNMQSCLCKLRSPLSELIGGVVPVVSAVVASSPVEAAAAAEAAAEGTAAASGRAGCWDAPSETVAAERQAAGRTAAPAAVRTRLPGVGPCPAAGASDGERAGSCTEPAGLTDSPRRAEEPAQVATASVIMMVPCAIAGDVIGPQTGNGLPRREGEGGGLSGTKHGTHPRISVSHLIVLIQQGINVDVCHNDELCICDCTVTTPPCLSACTRWSASTSPGLTVERRHSVQVPDALIALLNLLRRRW